MAGPLAEIYSASDSFKRKLVDALRNPRAKLEQIVGDANDRAGNLMNMTYAAAGEGPGRGPATDRLAKSMAESYNPGGITVWHGSGSLFPKFDVNRAPANGSAYTRGGYTAEAIDEAKGYAPRDPVYEERLTKMYNDASRRNDYPAMEVLEAAMMHRTPKEMASQFTLNEGYDPAFVRTASRVIKDVQKVPNKSYLYKVDLADEALPQMLQFDDSLALQKNPAVGALAKELGMSKAEQWLGGDVIGQLRSKGVSELDIPKTLRERGIPGLSYDSQRVKGSKNYVSYDPELYQILEVNDQPAQEIMKALRKKQ